MKKTFFALQTIKKEDFLTECDFVLEYYLLTNRIKENDENKYRNCYGVEVIKKYTDASGNEISQKGTAENLTTDKKVAYSLLRVIYNQKITPVCLYETIDDCFCDDILQRMEA